MTRLTGANGLGTWVKGSVAPVLASEFCQFIAGKSSVTGGGSTGSLRATREERESERSQISHNDVSWKNAEALKRRAGPGLQSLPLFKLSNHPVALNRLDFICRHYPYDYEYFGLKIYFPTKQNAYDLYQLCFVCKAYSF